MKQRNVSEGGGSRIAERREERQLTKRGRQQICATYYLRDAHEGVIYHDRQLVGDDSVGAQHDKIAAPLGRRATLLAGNSVGKGERCLRHMKPERCGAPLSLQPPALPFSQSKARSGVALPFGWRLRCAGNARQLGAGTEAWVKESSAQ
jgi:hypothetical protein